LAAASRSVFLRRAARFFALSLPWLFPIRPPTSFFSQPIPSDFASLSYSVIQNHLDAGMGASHNPKAAMKFFTQIGFDTAK